MKKEIVLGHVTSSDGIEVDKIKIDLIATPSPATCVKEVRSFLKHAGIYSRFIQNLSKIAMSLSSLPAKDLPFHFSKSV